MRIFYTLLLLALTAGISAQSATTQARAVAGANFISLLDRNGAGAGYLTTAGATVSGDKITFPIDESVYGELLGIYENFDHATATVAGDEISQITFPNDRSVAFTYSNGELSAIGDYVHITWENDRPVFAATEWTENDGKIKGDDWVRSAVYLKYDGQGRYTEATRYVEFAKGKSPDKLKPQKESMANLQFDYAYDGATITATSQRYKLKSRKWTPSPGTPTTYHLEFGTPGEVTYRSASGKLTKTFFYEDGKLVKDDMNSRLMGQVRTVTEYEYFRDWMTEKVEKKYSGDKLSETTTDSWDVIAMEPGSGEKAPEPSRVYAGGQVTNAEGTVIRERKLGHERRLNPDGTWTAWLARKGIGK